MSAGALMIQGTGSDVGKSTLVAALCRLARRRNLRVAPFKPQNMSNNAAACQGGGEIGRAQALQAMAAGVEPTIDHNPVLLKPETDRTAQIVVHGRALSTMAAADYMGSRDSLMQPVIQSFDRLRAAHDLIIVEGAGSPAEVNLRARDIANMGFARHAKVPVCLVGDIEKGGVIASLVGTQAVISREDAAMIMGFCVNKFRGDPRLFDDGVTTIVKTTGWPCFGVIPWLPAASRLPAEDAVTTARSRASTRRKVRIAAPMLSRMANFDDADPLRWEPSVDFQFVPPGQPLPRDADVIMLFGTKSTRGDLAFLREQGWDHDIHAHVRHGGHVFGVCGGYQMLGQTVSDPSGSDGDTGPTPGLGLLDVRTTMAAQKTVQPVTATCVRAGLAVSGYEIHVGRTDGPDCKRALLRINDRFDGAKSNNGRVIGTYVHGLFANDCFRQSYLRTWVNIEHTSSYKAEVEAAIDELADGVEAALDVDALLQAASAFAAP